MGELGSIWLYQEDDDAEDLKRKLQSTQMELEEVKLEINATKKLTMEKERQFHSLLQIACKERDEAREQLHSLILQCTTPPPPPPPPPILMNNSSISESNTLSDSLFNNSYISSSSPVDSIFDVETSSTEKFSKLKHTNMYDYDHDHATVMIDELVKGKELPRKGKFLEAVMEAGPLLQTLMLAGPLPSWRNPPTTTNQCFKIPQVTTPFVEMSCCSNSHLGSNISMLNFSNGDVRRVSLSPVMNMNNQIVVGKRQRLM